MQQITHHGGATGVTGSCHRLQLNAQQALLIDCGLFQGAETAPEGGAAAGRLAIDFSVQDVCALVATHVHIDHVGRIPYLLAAGFKGPILCSEPSARLLPIVLEDAFRLGISSDQQQVERFIKRVASQLQPLPYNHWFTLLDTPQQQVRLRLQRAGHILGSAYVEVELHERSLGQRERVVFSGDLGAPYTPILPSPKSPYKADTLVIESTYGDRLHENRRQRRQRLQGLLEQALRDQGTVLIPAFSIGRTQELLYELEDIIHRQAQAQAPRRAGKEQAATALDWANLPIILDSPLASRFNQVYRELDEFWDGEAHARLRTGRQPLAFRNLLTVDSHASHQAMLNRLVQTAQPAVVIAAGGMCSGGRIVNYLKAMLGDSRHNILFVGYQAVGTLGRQIQQYGPRGGYAEIDGQRYPIKAQVASVSGYSAHADQHDLLRFVTRMRHWPRQIHVVHGDSDAQQTLKKKLQLCYQQRGSSVQITTSADRDARP